MKKNLISFSSLNYFVMIVGAVLILINFFYNRSFWGDEAALALNIINRSYIELFQPLDSYQSAPILFLQLTKFFSQLIPNNEMGLRFFCLISYLLSLVIFYRLLSLLAKNQALILFALTLFVFNFILIRYSNEFKQYISDVMVTLTLIYFAVKPYTDFKKKYFYLSIIGVFSIFLSNISIIVMPGIGLGLLFKDVIESKKAKIKYLIFLGSSWAVAFGIYFILFIHNHPTQGFMIDAWRQMGAFLPKNPFSAAFYHSLNNMFTEIFLRLRLIPRYPIINVFIFYSLLFASIISLATQKKWSTLAFLLLPILTHLTLSAFELYPFFQRLVLYLFPILIILFTLGLEFIVNIIEKFIPKASKYVALGVFLLVSSSFFSGLKEVFPCKHMEFKETIDYLNENSTEKEIVYVNGASVSTLRYYQQIGLVNFKSPLKYGEIRYGVLGTDESDIISEKERLINEMDDLGEGKYWFLISRHSLRIDEEVIIEYFDSQGYEKLDEFFVPGVALYLYEITKCETRESE